MGFPSLKRGFDSRSPLQTTTRRRELEIQRPLTSASRAPRVPADTTRLAARGAADAHSPIESVVYASS